jgi:alginate O-acetyltransferase complex protein AlgI
MSFNSAQFLLFFAAVFSLYWLLPFRWQNRLLLAASLYFYASWDYRFVPLLLFSSLVGYVFGILIHKAEDKRRRKALVVGSVILNMSVLAFFKYFHFAESSLRSAFALIGVAWEPPGFHILLPIGISFYLFHTLSYLIDIYRGISKPTRSFPDVALFVAFFPLLVAGPIERAAHLLPEIQAARTFRWDKLVRGMDLILWGFFKKIFIADNLAVLVNRVYDNHEAYGGATILLATVAFAFQIYGDFSGYSDIARGISKFLGFELNLNFNLPYFAQSPSDFWKRWHISLSSWLRDYLYISMGGNRAGTLATYRNLVATMVLGGIWHGANWTFVIWGGYHGLGLVAQRLVPFPAVSRLPLPGAARAETALKIMLMFAFTLGGWMIFRCNDTGSLAAMAGHVFTRLRPDAYTAAAALQLLKHTWFLVLIQCIQYRRGDLRFLAEHRLAPRWLFYLFLLCCIFFMGNFNYTEFIYFQF